jgi:hypothetical protein
MGKVVRENGVQLEERLGGVKSKEIAWIRGGALKKEAVSGMQQVG